MCFDGFYGLNSSDRVAFVLQPDIFDWLPHGLAVFVEVSFSQLSFTAMRPHATQAGKLTPCLNMHGICTSCILSGIPGGDM